MENYNLGISDIPKMEESNSASYTVSSEANILPEINYFPVGLIEFDFLTNRIDLKKDEKIAAPNNMYK